MLTPIVVPTFVIVEHETTEHFALRLLIVATANKIRLILCRASPVQKAHGASFRMFNGLATSTLVIRD